ncbi:3-beta hydroxysteroid dehydrogenase [Microbacterium sp. HD4P20]|uniref:SDR family oxidoreductase n=1 Tax=Microbacterium sp. HD4P20 TaxID=2864874 RepID=UPI001C643BF1|nr:NAD-dependent epimerase/dehydratase family protein [Microbacterium sp. HD4P20]MCP2636165.1 3-beta hydroxysteroid dehydrogenase [Microbacterium sp. HD4P20]
MKLAIAGGTGLTGAHLTARAAARGHDVVVLSRSTGVELLSGAGLAGRLDGVDAVIDATNVTTSKPDVSVSFFAGVTKSLLTAERLAKVPHHLALTIVGADAAPDGYYAGKLVQERLIANGPTPWTLLRTTQFHEFAAMLFHRGRAGMHVAPHGRVQPIAVAEVAEHLLDLSEGEPAGRTPDLAGPREEDLLAMVRAYAHAIGSRGLVAAMDPRGAYGHALRSGALLPGREALLGRQTFAQWLDALPDA